MDPTWVIVNDKNQYLGWFHASVDEFDNICSRGVTWVDNWQSAQVWYSARGAQRAYQRAQRYSFMCKVALVGGYPERKSA